MDSLLTTTKRSQNNKNMETSFDATLYWCLRVKEGLIKLGSNVNSVDLGIFYWKEKNRLVGLLASHVDVMIWGGDEMFKTNIRRGQLNFLL